jgi:benzil reductase ((S)-benzoin forming)
MQHIFITGSSRGLGKALTDLLLVQPKTTVTGMARNSGIEHPNYTHEIFDLADVSAAKAFEFVVPEGTTKVLLINNAGRIGDVKRLGSIDDNDVERTYNVNLVSPSILCNRFIAAFEGAAMEKIIVNVSSGAAKHAIDAWGTYCATKAGLEMLSESINVEQGIGVEYPVKVLSVAPGIVDTGMQTHIRAANPADFSRHAEFTDFKDEGALVSPEAVAAKFMFILNNVEKFDETSYSVRDLD